MKGKRRAEELKKSSKKLKVDQSETIQSRAHEQDLETENSDNEMNLQDLDMSQSQYIQVSRQSSHHFNSPFSNTLQKSNKVTLELFIENNVF